MDNKFTYYRSTALANGALVKATPGIIYAGRVTYTGVVTPMYLQIHNVAAVPADAQVPHLSYHIAGGWFDNFDPMRGWEFDTGIYICLSTTEATKTLATDTKALFYLQYL